MFDAKFNDSSNIQTTGFTICPASVDEAADLARLAVLASDGLTLATWEDMRVGDETAMQVGCNRAARQSGAFSYANADIAMQDLKVIAAIVTYAMRPDTNSIAPADVPPVFRPLLALEARAVPSWYINILATYPEARGQGVATGLIGEVEKRAKTANFRHLSLIVGDNNPARKLYESLGFNEVSREQAVHDSHNSRDDNWILLKKKIF